MKKLINRIAEWVYFKTARKSKPSFKNKFEAEEFAAKEFPDTDIYVMGENIYYLDRALTILGYKKINNN